MFGVGHSAPLSGNGKSTRHLHRAQYIPFCGPPAEDYRGESLTASQTDQLSRYSIVRYYAAHILTELVETLRELALQQTHVPRLKVDSNSR
jgi:hypothetical protein